MRISQLLSVFVTPSLILLLFAQSSTSANPKLKPLFFPADKNNLQVLPQRFEYTLLDDERLKVGDILMDASFVTFKVETSESGKYRLQFTWPAGLLKEGQLSLRNNSGKAILSSRLSPDNLKITPQTTMNEEQKLRSDVAQFFMEEVDSDLMDEMKYLPFMTFCISRESQDTHLSLCSKELYMSSQGGQIIIKPRTAVAKRVARVEVNGKIVGNQGIIYLNDTTESISFIAQTQSGANLEISTRKKDVDFKDIVLSKDETELSITASGAEPVDENKVQKISKDEWRIRIPAARPVLYLRGEGDIPMRQEFYIKGPLPKENDRLHLSARAEERTYSSSLRFQGLAPANTKVSPADTTSRVEPRGKNQFLWSIEDIPSGLPTRRYLNVTGPGKKQVAAYDVFRGNPYELYAGLHYLSPSGIAFADLSFQWWFENFLLLNNNVTRFHWGLALSHNQHLTTNDNELEVDFSRLELLWRAQEGFFLQDETWGLGLPLLMIKSTDSSTLAPGLSFFLQKKAPYFLSKIASWSQLKIDYFTSSSGGDFKLSSGYEIKALLYKALGHRLYLRYGLGLSQYEFEGASSDIQLGLEGGLSWHF